MIQVGFAEEVILGLSWLEDQPGVMERWEGHAGQREWLVRGSAVTACPRH